LTAGDDEPSAETCAVVIGHTFWTTTLRRDPAVLGRPLMVREKACTIVGVAPADFRSTEPGYAPELWVPLRPLTDPKLLASRGMAFFSGVMGRLRPETSLAQAEAELTALYQRMQLEDQPAFQPRETPPKPKDFRIEVKP